MKSSRLVHGLIAAALTTGALAAAAPAASASVQESRWVPGYGNAYYGGYHRGYAPYYGGYAGYYGSPTGFGFHGGNPYLGPDPTDDYNLPPTSPAFGGYGGYGGYYW